MWISFSRDSGICQFFRCHCMGLVWRQPDGTCFSVVDSRPIVDMKWSCKLGVDFWTTSMWWVWPLLELNSTGTLQRKRPAWNPALIFCRFAAHTKSWHKRKSPILESLVLIMKSEILSGCESGCHWLPATWLTLLFEGTVWQILGSPFWKSWSVRTDLSYWGPRQTLFGLVNKEQMVVESQRWLDCFCLLLEEGMQCLPEVGVPAGFAYLPPYQRFPGERRFDLEQQDVPLLQDQNPPCTQTLHCPDLPNFWQSDPDKRTCRTEDICHKRGRRQIYRKNIFYSVYFIFLCIRTYHLSFVAALLKTQ